MNASAVAETPPVISSVTPRSQVISDTVVMPARVSCVAENFEQGRRARTDHGGDEDDGSEENVPLHVEGLVREEILLNYLYGPTSSWRGALFIKKGKRCTSRHTKSSSGSVVNIFSPKQNRAKLIRVSFCGAFGSKSHSSMMMKAPWDGEGGLPERSC